MIVASIDLRGGKAVQLQQGERHVLERHDVAELAVRFGRLGEIAVIDLDAAFGEGDNLDLILELCRLARCRVGGGIRTVERARRLLRGGAASVIVGTAATPEFLTQLPRERVLVALDERNGRVAVDGWRSTTSETPVERAMRLAPYCAGFLATQIEREGMLGGIDIDRAAALRAAVPGSLTVAGGITTADEVVALDKLGIDAQVGMAIYTGALDPVEAFCATIDWSQGTGADDRVRPRATARCACWPIRRARRSRSRYVKGSAPSGAAAAKRSGARAKRPGPRSNCNASRSIAIATR